MKRPGQQDHEDSAKKPTVDYSSYLNQEIFKPKFCSDLQKNISNQSPYKWGSIHDLVDPQLLKDVRLEILSEIHFTEKETDIYKVFQSGDLRNLNGLDKKDKSRLPNILKLRNALYCPKFRDFISQVTQAGKISANKYDMSLNIYHKSCHLLTHDDVIGSRRVSFILYLPDPDKTWKDHYGGGLRLFGAHYSNVPKSDYLKKFVPQFNDYAFFEVKPGYSFHDVEEVKADKQRISIQGWFHIPQDGEEGYIPGEQKKFENQSTLQQLESKEFQLYDFPKLCRDPIDNNLFKNLTDFYASNEKLKDFALKKLDFEYLSKYLNPALLSPGKLKDLSGQFLTSSLVTIEGFLNDEFSNELKALIKKKEFLEDVPKLSKDVKLPWKTAMSCVKRRYLYIDGNPLDPELADLQFENETQQEVAERQKTTSADSDFQSIAETSQDPVVKKMSELAIFLKSFQFKKFLILVASLIPVSQQVLIRRFRPGSDFTLATNQETKTESTLLNSDFEPLEAVLEGTLCLTPSKGWDSGEFGGYELCMTMDENDDPAIYRNSNNEDSVLLNQQASWNTFNLILRDACVLKFIKYVSYLAKGSRWDLSCQWDVMGETEEEEE